MAAPNRVSVVYIVMLGCCVVGLWGILAVGQHLKPPPNLSGQWVIAAESSAAPTAQSLGQKMQVDQSGRFFQISFEKQPAISMRLHEYTATHAELAGHDWRLTFDGIKTSEGTRVVITAPDSSKSGSWVIHRVEKSTTEPGAARGAH